MLGAGERNASCRRGRAPSMSLPTFPPSGLIGALSALSSLLAGADPLSARTPAANDSTWLCNDGTRR